MPSQFHVFCLCRHRHCLLLPLPLPLPLLLTEDQGPPKKRLLRVNDAVTRLYWSEPLDGKPKSAEMRTLEPGEELDPMLPPEMYASIAIDSIRYVRTGTDEDTSAPNLVRRKSMFSGQQQQEQQQKLGSANLRRTCAPNDLDLSLCLVLLDSRTVDIQCLSKESFFVIYPNLFALCAENDAARQRAREADDDDG